ncbi:MAG: hypothetical protein EXS63_00030 [Candidatus Omnitrophica bacterium]|nr:hypothetical protein [Candidatus Omnitrophota bacterium]
MMKEIVLEGLAAQIEEATLQNWFFEEGDRVNKGDELVQLSTGDGTLLIPAIASGVLAEVYFDEGETVPRGDVLCLIDDEKDLGKDEENDDDKEEAEEDEEDDDEEDDDDKETEDEDEE